MDIYQIAHALGGEVRQGQVVAPGPGHSQVDRSMSVMIDINAPDGFIINSFAGDDPIVCKDYVRQKLGLPAFRPNGDRPRRSKDYVAQRLNAAIFNPAPRSLKIVAEYDYTDASGALLYQVCRHDPKDFRQRRPDGHGGWIADAGERKVLYRWPELAKYPDGTVFVTEGEKDADRVASLGLCATTVASAKWTSECVNALAGRDVLILEDNDDAGRKKGNEAASLLHTVAKSVRIVRLPGLPDGGDVSDWLDADRAHAEMLADICFAAPLWKSVAAEPKHSEQTPPAADLTAAFTFEGDTPAAPPRELIKKLLPAFGVAVTGGQSTAGKTFIQIHKAVCLATALPYFGHRIVERVGTVLVAAEGRALIPNRVAAAKAKIGITDKLPITWIKQIPDFSSPDGIKLFIAQLKELNQRFLGDFGVRLGHGVVDTVAACFAMKDEDDNSEATKVCNILLAIGEETGALMAPVHHFGKNPESGLRGASAWKGSADIVEGVLADIDPLSGRASNRELVCAKARDGEQGPLSAFELEWLKLGTDEFGEDYGSCAVVPSVEGRSRFDKTATPTKSQRAIQEAIDEALDGRGQVITPRAGMAPVRAAKVGDVRAEFDRRYVVVETDPAQVATAKRVAFKRALDRLPPSQFGAGSAEGTDWIWRIS